MDTTATAAPPPDDNNPELAKFVTLAFTMVQLHLNRSRHAWFLAGMWLYRLKARLGHGLFSAELARHAIAWDTSEKTLRRRMQFYRKVRKGIVVRYYGSETPAQIRARLIALEAAAERGDAADARVAELEVEIRDTAAKSLEAHRDHRRPAAATLKVEGLNKKQREFLLSTVRLLRASFADAKFNERLLEFFAAWAQELPPEEHAANLRQARTKRRARKRLAHRRASRRFDRHCRSPERRTHRRRRSSLRRTRMCSSDRDSHSPVHAG